MFQTLNNIFETNISFGKMFVSLEYQVEKIEHASKAYDDVVDWKRYVKEKP